MLSCQAGLGPMRKSLTGKPKKTKSPGTFCLAHFPIALFWPWEKSLNCGNTVLVKLACVNEEITTKKKTFKSQPVENMTSCRKHFHKETFGSLLGHYSVNSIKRSHSHKKTLPERGTQGKRDTLQLLNSSGWEKIPLQHLNEGCHTSTNVMWWIHKFILSLLKFKTEMILLEGGEIFFGELHHIFHIYQ